MEEATVGEGGGGVDRRTIVDGVNGESVGYEDSSCRGEVGSYPENLTGYESDTSSAPCDSVKDSSCDSTRSVSSEAGRWNSKTRWALIKESRCGIRCALIRISG